MAERVASLEAKIGADTSDLQRGLADAGSRLNAFGGQLGNTAKSGTSALAGLGNSLSKIGFAVFGIQQVAGAVGKLATSLVDQNVELEQAGAQIQAFTKDAVVTKNVLAAIRSEADKTPFAFNEMAAAVGSLIPSAKGVLSASE